MNLNRREIKIIFLILMLVGYVITNLYKKEEKKEKERRINKRPIDKQTAEEIFRNLQKTLNLPDNTGSPYNKPSKPQIAVEKSLEHPKTYRSLKNEMVRLSDQRIKPRHSGLGNRKRKTYGKPMEANAEVIETIEERPAFQMDLRQAIIYSEILKRPQY